MPQSVYSAERSLNLKRAAALRRFGFDPSLYQQLMVELRRKYRS